MLFPCKFFSSEFKVTSESHWNLPLVTRSLFRQGAPPFHPVIWSRADEGWTTGVCFIFIVLYLQWYLMTKVYKFQRLSRWTVKNGHSFTLNQATNQSPLPSSAHQTLTGQLRYWFDVTARPYNSYLAEETFRIYRSCLIAAIHTVLPDYYPYYTPWVYTSRKVYKWWFL